MALVADRHELRTTPPRRRHYPHAPIIETVLELRFTPDAGATPQRLRAFGERESKVYPERGDVHQFAGQFAFDAKHGARAKGEKRHHGYIFRDRKGTQAFHALIDKFAYSKLKPYSEWETVKNEAQRLWGRYVTELKPKSLSYVGLRYVNRLDLPAPVTRLNDWLNTFPTIANGISQILSGYTMQLLLPQPDLPGAVVALTQAVVQPARADVVSIVLDIDMRMPIKLAPNHPELWHRIQLLHDRENMIFESTITERVRELIV